MPLGLSAASARAEVASNDWVTSLNLTLPMDVGQPILLYVLAVPCFQVYVLYFGQLF